MAYLETVAITAGRPAHHPHAPLNTGIELSSTFVSDDRAEPVNHYQRSDGDATLVAFETLLAQLESPTMPAHALGFRSGMAATSVVLAGLPAGSVVVTHWRQYSGTSMLLAEQERLGHLQTRWVDVSDTEATIAALPGATVLWVETPSNPMLAIADLPALVHAAHDLGVLVVVDSTLNSPVVLRPLEHGADLVMHSATKYLAGHSDVLMGALVTRDDELAQTLHARRTLTGGVPGQLETYLTTRGIRTLALRMERAQANAAELARRLDDHPAVSRVHFPGLPGNPFHQRAATLHDGFGALISFEVADAVAATRLCRAVKVITHGTSLGGVESLIERRAMHATDSARGVPAELLRLSVGIEHVQDLWDDLDQALTSS